MGSKSGVQCHRESNDCPDRPAHLRTGTVDLVLTRNWCSRIGGAEEVEKSKGVKPSERIDKLWGRVCGPNYFGSRNFGAGLPYQCNGDRSIELRSAPGTPAR